MVSPLWQCGIVETTSHYLLHRPLYIAHRDVMLDFRLITADSTITNITTELLLYSSIQQLYLYTYTGKSFAKYINSLISVINPFSQAFFILNLRFFHIFNSLIV